MNAALVQLSIEPSGRLHVKARDTEGLYTSVHRGDLVKPVDGSWLIPIGQTSVFQIVNYHFCDQYTVHAVNGTVSIEDDLIYYTPNTVYFPSFWLDSRRFLFTGYDPKISPPQVLSPQDGQQDVPWFGEINSSAFVSNDDTIAHDKTIFQVAEDAYFGTLVVNQEITSNLLQGTYQGLIPGQSYYVRVRHEGELP